MHKLGKKALAKKFGSKSGKLKKKHLVRAKFFIRGKESYERLNGMEINMLLDETEL